MPSTWDHKADKDLLLTIIEEGALKSIDWPNISARLTRKGYAFSKEACRQHFQKIRKDARANNEANSEATSTPKRASNSLAKSAGNKGGKANGSFSYGRENDDDDEEMNTPTKRKRVTKVEKQEDMAGFNVQNAMLFKMEDMNGNRSPIDLIREDIYA
jgi:hypothetical protein